MNGRGTRGLATAWTVLAGSLWLVSLYEIVDQLFGAPAAALWVVAALLHAVPDVREMWDESRPPRRAWWVSFRWWLESFAAPVFAVVRLWRPLSTPPRSTEPSNADATTLASLERRLGRVESELAELRALTVSARVSGPAPAAEPEPAVTEPAAVEPEPVIEPLPIPIPTMLDLAVPPLTRAPEGRPGPVAAAAPPRLEPREAEPFARPYLDRLRSIETSDLLGARVLAWAGGVVTLLGIVFFFVLAVNRGWIGPEIRVACGGLASALCFGAGAWLHRRYGDVYSALTAAGAGIAGAYATLLAAAVLYDLLPALVALACAAGIAAVGASTALRWDAESLAGLGLIGAMLVPAAVVLQGGVTPLGTGFVAVVFAAAAYVAIERRWLVLLVLGIVAGLPQVALLVAQDTATGSAAVAAVATAFWLLYLATATRWHARLGGGELEPGPAGLVVTASVLATTAATRIFDTADGVALLVVFAVEAALAAALSLRPRFRGLAAVAGIGALTALAIASAVLAGGSALTSVWAGEAAALAWLAAHVSERRFQLAAFGYLGLAIGNALTVEARPGDLLVSTPHPGDGAASAGAIALAAGAVAVFAREWPDRRRSGGVLAPLDRLVDALGSVQGTVRTVAGWTAGAFAVYAASLALLELGFEGGQTGVTTLWSALGLGLVAGGLRSRRQQVRVAGLVLLAVALVKAFEYDVHRLSRELESLSLFAVGIAAVLAGVVEQRLSPRPWRLEPQAAMLLAVGVCATAAGTVGLGGQVWLLAPAAGLALIWALTFTGVDSRDLAALLAVPALTFAGAAAADALDGTWLVLAFSAAAVALAGAASGLREPRFRLAALAFAGLALAHVLALEARPDELFAEHDPAGGIPAVLFAGAAALALGVELRRRYARRPDEAQRGRDYDEVVRALEWLRPYGAVAALWTAGTLAVYAASLALLAIDFDDAQPAVTALWCAVGLACVASGRYRSALRLGGLAFLAAALLKALVGDAALDDTLLGLSFAAAAAGWALADFADQRLDRRRGLGGAAAALLCVGAILSAEAAYLLGVVPEHVGSIRAALEAERCRGSSSPKEALGWICTVTRLSAGAVGVVWPSG